MLVQLAYHKILLLVMWHPDLSFLAQKALADWNFLLVMADRFCPLSEVHLEYVYDNLTPMPHLRILSKPQLHTLCISVLQEYKQHAGGVVAFFY